MTNERIVLQFLMTGGLTPTRREFEQLHSPGDFDRWLRTVVAADDSDPATPQHLELAIELREAVFLTIRANTVEQRPITALVELINRVAARAPLSPLLGADGKTQEWRRPIHPSGALATIARDAIDLLTGPTGDRVRECANPNCELVFVDVSPPGLRRWCAMKRCGNRSKTKAYRTRQRSGPTQDRPVTTKE